MSEETTPPGINDYEAYYRSYFGYGADYYLDKLAHYRQGHKISFNVGAFVFGVFWMLYRKLYLETVFVLMLLVAISVLLESGNQHLGTPQERSFWINHSFTLAWSFMLGFLGNWMYLRHTEAKVKKVLQKETEKEQAIQRLQLKGGITLIPHIGIAFLVLIALLFFSTSSLR